jgi:hypothetical protein
MTEINQHDRDLKKAPSCCNSISKIQGSRVPNDYEVKKIPAHSALLHGVKVVMWCAVHARQIICFRTKNVPQNLFMSCEESLKAKAYLYPSNRDYKIC